MLKTLLILLIKVIYNYWQLILIKNKIKYKKVKTEIEYYSTFEGLYIYSFESRIAWICFNKKTEDVIHYLQFENEEPSCDNQYTLQE